MYGIYRLNSKKLLHTKQTLAGAATKVKNLTRELILVQTFADPTGDRMISPEDHHLFEIKEI